MAETSAVRLANALPAEVVVDPAQGFALTPNQIRRLKEVSGQSFTDLMAEDADDADRMQALAWVQLTRDGYEVTWAEAGDISVRAHAEAPDPTSAAP